MDEFFSFVIGGCMALLICLGSFGVANSHYLDNYKQATNYCSVNVNKEKCSEYVIKFKNSNDMAAYELLKIKYKNKTGKDLF